MNWNFLDFLPVPALIIDENYRVIYSNREAEKVFGKKGEQCFEIVEKVKNPYEREGSLICPKTYLELLNIEDFGAFQTLKTLEGKRTFYVLTSKLENNKFLEIFIDISKHSPALFHIRPDIIFSEGPVIFTLIENKKGLPVRYITPNVREILGYSQEDFLSERVLLEYVINHEDLKRFMKSVSKNKSDKSSVDIRFRSKEGKTKWLRIFLLPVKKGEETTHFYGYMIDVTDKYERETLFKVLAEHNPNGVMMYDFYRGEVLYVNKALLDIAGIKSIEEISDVKKVMNFIHPEDREKLMEVISRRIAGEKGKITYYLRIFSKSGEEKYLKIISSVVNYMGREVSLMTVIDISHEKRTEKKLKDLSERDQLTGLYNRRYLDMKLNELVEIARNEGRKFSIILFDIDNFKKINDTYGHQVGDEVLIKISEAVKETLRETDIFGRWGGEEFLVILPDTEEPCAVAERIRKIVESLKFTSNLKVSVSLGATVYREKDTPESIINRADEALYTAKEKGKNRTECL